MGLVMNTIADQLVYNTTRIECRKSNGEMSVGTGFFVNLDLEGRGIIPVLVTNKHVIDNASSGSFYLNERDEVENPIPGKHFPVNIPFNFSQFWIYHPDEIVDLAILPFQPHVQEAAKAGKKLYYKTFSSEFIATKEYLESLTPIEDISVIGYPNGIWDHVNGMPIARRGSTATHPKLDFQGQPNFLIDCAIYPGSSGSPVILYNPMGYATPQGFNMGARLKLIGVVHQVANHSVEGTIEFKSVPTNSRPTPRVSVPNNLGVVVKSTKIFELAAPLEEYLRKLESQGLKIL